MTLRQALSMLWIKMRYPGLARDLSRAPDGRVSVDLGYAPVSNLRPLKRVRLQYLGLYGTPVTQWGDLADLEFRELDVGGTSIDSLAPIAKKPLTRLELYRTPVLSLQEVEGMPISLLQVGETAIRDFSPISRLPLKVLLMLHCDVDDLSFLDGLQLTHFAFTFSHDTKGMEHLRRMSSLETISTTEHDTFAPDEFWRRFDNRLPLNEHLRRYRRENERLET